MGTEEGERKKCVGSYKSKSAREEGKRSCSALVGDNAYVPDLRAFSTPRQNDDVSHVSVYTLQLPLLSNSQLNFFYSSVDG